MKKVLAALLIACAVISTAPNAWATNTATHGEIKGKTVAAGLLSAIVWPGIGQYMNDNQTKKNWTHAIAGLFPLFRLWSGWDALIDRQGGRWDGKI